MAEEKKIIIDEDWKDQVRREKEEAARKAAEAEKQAASAANAKAGAPGTDHAAGDDTVPGAEAEETTPFMALVQSLATQALLFLGYIPQPGSQEVMVDLGQSRMVIDMLVDLRSKTAGNLNADEEAMLAEAVSELQRAFVVRSQQVQEAELKRAGLNPQDLKQKPR